MRASTEPGQNRLPPELDQNRLSSEPVELSDIVGGYGPWQRKIFVLLFLASIPSAWHNLQMTFMAPQGVDFWCSRPPGFQLDVQEWRNLSAPPVEFGLDPRCHMKPYWKIPSNMSVHESDIVKCSSWEYDSSFYPSTIIDEWDLVCDREWLISFSKSIYNIGYLVAVLVLGQLSDSMGRRPTLLLSFVLNVTAGLLSAFSTSFAVFAILRFFTAVGGAGFYTVSFVILVETVSPSIRPVVGVSINFGWCLAFVSLPAVAWFVRDWFWLQLALTLPKLLFVAIFWVIPESPRWLLAKDDRDSFRKVALQAGASNGLKEAWVTQQVDKLLLLRKTDSIHKPGTATLIDLFRTPRLRRNTLVLFYNWLVNSFIYFALSYNTGDLVADLYLSFFLSGVVEFPAYLLTIYVLKRAGRRLPLAWGMIAGGAACALAIPIPSEITWLKAIFPLVGKFCITATFAIAYVYSAEIFPTVVRNVGLGTGSTVARIGSTIAPFVRELGTATHPSLPDVTYALLSVSSGCLTFLLPETNNQPFADSLQQAEDIGLKEMKINKKEDKEQHLQP